MTTNLTNREVQILEMLANGLQYKDIAIVFGNTAKGDEILEAISNVLSKLESQILRNPDLPKSYRSILNEGYAARACVQWLLSNLCPNHQDFAEHVQWGMSYVSNS